MDELNPEPPVALETIKNDEVVRRRHFPVVEKEIFLANAAVCPLPSVSAEAMSRYAMAATRGDQEARFPATLFGATRRLAAELIGAKPADVALVGPTSIGLSLVANGLDWQPGDNVVFNPEDYPSNAVVWMHLARRGVEARPLDMAANPGTITLAELRRKVDARTRLVALSSAHFVTGERLDVATIGPWLKEQGVLFCLDAIQTVGALATPARYVDFLAADAHKWMLGPCAAGILYVAPEARPLLEPSLLGWSNVVCPNFLTPETVTFPDDARRYEAGSANLIGLAGMHASLAMLNHWGSEATETAILQHTRTLREELRRLDFTLAGASDESISGITACHRKGTAMPDLHRKLSEQGVTASLRQTRDGQHWLRFSPHAYNTRSEIDETLRLLADL
jgi:cysteine desulfurase/selenocysteine lyase